MSFDLSLEAACIADMSIIVKARIVEAADTMAHVQMRGLRPAMLKAFWPQSLTEFLEDADSAEAKKARLKYRPSADAISRAEEVGEVWMLKLVEDEEHRIILGKWALCRAAPWVGGSFREFCKATGRVRKTAERRIDRQIHGIAAALSGEHLREPEWSRVLPILQPKGDQPASGPSNWMDADARPDAASPPNFKWANRQNRRRKTASQKQDVRI